MSRRERKTHLVEEQQLHVSTNAKIERSQVQVAVFVTWVVLLSAANLLDHVKHGFLLPRAVHALVQHLDNDIRVAATAGDCGVKVWNRHQANVSDAVCVAQNLFPTEQLLVVVHPTDLRRDSHSLAVLRALVRKSGNAHQTAADVYEKIPTPSQRWFRKSKTKRLPRQCILSSGANTGVQEVRRNHHAGTTFASLAVDSHHILRMLGQVRIDTLAKPLHQLQRTWVVIVKRAANSQQRLWEC